jgi:O-antigen/teichoic acid export membrane protein
VSPPVTGERDADGTDLLDTSAAGPAAIRGGVIRIVGYGATVLMSVASAAVLFRYLGVVETGQYVTVVSLIGVAQGLTDIGISALGVREMSVRDAAGRESLMRTLLGLRLVMTVIGVVGAVAFAAVAGYTDAMVLGTALAGAGLVVQNIQGTLAIDLMSRLRYVAVTAADLARQTVMVALVIGLVVVGAELPAFLAATIAAAAAALVVTALALRGAQVPMRPSFRSREWLVLTREALPFVVATAVYALYFRIAIILVSLIADDQDVGYFGAAFRIIEVLLATPALAISAAFPIFARAARDDLDRLRYGVGRTFHAALLFGALVALVLALGAPLAIRLVAGAEFEEAVPLLRIESIALGAAFVSQTFGFALLSMRRHREILVLSIVSLVLTAALTALLTASDGVRGAAIAVAIGEVGTALAAGIAFHRALPDARVPLAPLWQVSVALAAAAGGAIALGGPSLVQAAVGAVIYVAVLAAVRGIPPEVTEELRRLRRATAARRDTR